MEYIQLAIPNEEQSVRDGSKVCQPNLKLFTEILQGEHENVFFPVTNDNLYLSLLVKEDDNNLVQNNNNSYGILPDSIQAVVINPPQNDRNKNKNFFRLCLEIAINGRYIPVLNKEGNVIFSEQSFNYIRAQMYGLSHYGLKDEFELASLEELLMDSVEINGKIYDIQTLVKEIEQNIPKTERLRDYIISAIEDRLEKEGITLDTELLNDPLVNAELIDIGSTGRGTNLPGDGDFDFMMRVSGENYYSAVQYFSSRILDTFGLKSHDVTRVSGNDLRLSNVFLQGVDEPLKIDVTFAEKSSKITYSTEMCIQDRLNTIKEKYPDKYNLVLANIVLAKSLLKDYRAYKKKSSREDKQGGMGGIGVETWILQHGGSFLRASESFLQVAKGSAESLGYDLDTLIEFAKNNNRALINNVINEARGKEVESMYRPLLDVFYTFQTYYPVYDFGQNHKVGKANSRRSYPHDDFIYNMNAVGFYKMLDGLVTYRKKLEEQMTDEKSL